MLNVCACVGKVLVFVYTLIETNKYTRLHTGICSVYALSAIYEWHNSNNSNNTGSSLMPIRLEWIIRYKMNDSLGCHCLFDGIVVVAAICVCLQDIDLKIVARLNSKLCTYSYAYTYIYKCT